MQTTDSIHPVLIQGGMGISVSSWRLAQTVAAQGQLGVVSCTAIERVVVCELQEGDPGGHRARAFAAFPDQELAQRLYQRWHRPAGLPAPGRYDPLPMFDHRPSTELQQLAVVAAFSEVYLAKEGHRGVIGVNLLEKIQCPTMPVIYGALLAGADYLFMGAGIPKTVPAMINDLAEHRPCTQQLSLTDGDREAVVFDPRSILAGQPAIRRPYFIPIVSSHVLAMSLARVDGVDGFVVEGHGAGGHNAPPRGWTAGTGTDPDYGPRDQPDLQRIAGLGLPFWIAGGQGNHDDLVAAQAAGAVGIQVGTAFAFSRDSGLHPTMRRLGLERAARGEWPLRTDGRASPTGFPFKVLALPGSAGSQDADAMPRETCRFGYLRTAYRKADGGVGWRCPAEPEADYIAKGGDPADCAGRRCVCRGLLATAGHTHARRDGFVEPPLVTTGELGSDYRQLDDYSAADVIGRILGVAATR